MSEMGFYFVVFGVLYIVGAIAIFGYREHAKTRTYCLNKFKDEPIKRKDVFVSLFWPLCLVFLFLKFFYWLVLQPIFKSEPPNLETDKVEDKNNKPIEEE